MPIYAYRCSSCEFEKDCLQKLSDPHLTECPSCGGGSFARQVSAPAFQLKGSGWYVTDFRDGDKTGNQAAQQDKGQNSAEASKSGDSDSASATKSDADKSSAKAESSSSKSADSKSPSAGDSKPSSGASASGDGASAKSSS